MALTTTWAVSIGDATATTSFTSRVLGMSIDQQVDVNVIGRGTCTITLLNKDGALTPGGGGTYSTTDWFALGVFVSATISDGTSTTVQVFHGLINDFQLIDDGVFSTVQITALDGLTVAGRAPANNFPASTFSYDNALSYGTAALYAQWPRLGGLTGALGVINRLSGSNPNVTATTETFSSTADILQSAIIPSANDVCWATIIELIPGTVEYRIASIPDTNTRTVANSDDLEFDPPASLSGSKLPFDADTFKQAFNNDTLISTATIDGLVAGTSSQTATSANLNKYGARTVSFTSTFSPDDTYSLNMANKLVNRYGNTRFTPTSLQTSASLVKARAADAAKSKWAALLSIQNGIWQKAKITWTGSGAASQTAYCVVKGRTINVTPDDTLVTLSLGNWADNHSFILDTDQLDTDRLG